MEWPARSPKTIEELKDRIRSMISLETIRKVLGKFWFRMDVCLAKQGGCIEHYLKFFLTVCTAILIFFIC